MYVLKCKTITLLQNNLCRLYSSTRKTHYEVLNLHKNCTDKEIKKAFVKMSKEYHPDINKDAQAQDKFVRIVEAYSILSKPNKRAHYDNMSEVNINSNPFSHPYNQPFMYRPHVPYNMRRNYDFTYTQSKSQESPKNPFDGAPLGINKIPNAYLVMACIGIAIIGFVLQTALIREAYTFQRRQALEKSKRLSEELDRVHSAAKRSDNMTHTQQLLDKIVSASNPSVATASLGQALANEKK